MPYRIRWFPKDRPIAKVHVQLSLLVCADCGVPRLRTWVKERPGSSWAWGHVVDCDCPRPKMQPWWQMRLC